MPLQLTLRVGETTAQDVPLHTGGMITSYLMNSPDIDQEVLSDLADGNTFSVPTFSNVTESIDLMIQGSEAVIAAKVQAIERLLDLARQGTTGYLDDKLYLVAQYPQDTEVWRSQILAAKWVAANIADEMYRGVLTGTITLTRRYYWETEAIKAISCTSGATVTATTGFVTVYNADDTSATNRNWWQCAADQVVGTLPAPAKIEIQNNTGASRIATNVYLGNYVFTNPTGVDPIYRGEEKAGGTGIAHTAEDDLMWWSLSSGSLVNSFKNQFGRVLVVFTSQPNTDTLLRAAMQLRFFPAPLDLAVGEPVLAAAGEAVMDLGSIPIPPGDYWQNSSPHLYLTLKAKVAAGRPDDTIGFDWIQVFPSGVGRYRVLRGFVQLTMGDGDILVDDGINGGVYGQTGTEQMPIYRPYFMPIHLWPNKINRLRLIIGGLTIEAGQAWQVRMSYRPRRLSI